MQKIEMKDLVNLCQARGFVYQWSEIYGWLANSFERKYQKSLDKRICSKKRWYGFAR